MARPAAVVLLIAALLAGAAAGGVDADPLRRSPVVQAVEKASPAVVNISTEEAVEPGRSPFPFPTDPFFDEFFRDFFEPRPRRLTRTSLGSGVIARPDGTIVTNAHVILRASRIHVTLADEREFDADLIGADTDSDLAVLRVHARGPLPVIAVESAVAEPIIGETVIAIGNPFGLSHTVTTGVVSAVDRSLRAEDHVYTDFIQTDASINPGNSGGPLLNIRGDLIGINSAIYGKAQGIGFAIPAGRVRRVMRDLVSYGEVRRPWIGLVVRDLTPELARHFEVRRGVVVFAVEPGSPAAAAGVERGDAITHVNGRPVASRDEFEQRLRDSRAGDRLSLTRSRDGRVGEVTITAGTFPLARADDLAWDLLGLEVRPDGDGLAVRRVRRGSPAAAIGVAGGDRLLGLGGRPVQSLAEFRSRIVELRDAESVLLSIGRGPYRYNVHVRLARDGAA
jgi:S1-C subfamily serine protease